MFYHVKVSQGTQTGPEEWACLDRLDPQGVRQQHAEDGNSFVIIGACHGTGNVARDNGDHGRCYQSRSSILQSQHIPAISMALYHLHNTQTETLVNRQNKINDYHKVIEILMHLISGIEKDSCSYLEFLGEPVCNQGGEAGEHGGKEHTDVSDVNGDVEEPQDVVENSRCHHQS